MKGIIKKYKHIVIALYTPIYLMFFFTLEHMVTENFTPLNSPIDDLIPFVPIFIIPYIIWFFYMAGACVFSFLASQRDFVKMTSFFMAGMTLYIIICWVFPNGLYNFRPSDFAPDSRVDRLVTWLYATDTSTNVFPSIHVYNSIGVHIMVCTTDKIRHYWIKLCSFIICVLICLSTIFLKQHSLIDVLGACVMADIFYRLVYKSGYADFVDRKAWHTSPY